jgi:4a-hydroxytetrahydrobiopterin dehydratase
MSLAQQKCAACSGDLPALAPHEAQNLLAQLAQGWQLTHQNTRLYRQFRFKTFKGALKLVNLVAEVAEEEKHHPNFHFTWGEVELEIWTHEVGGLTENDFILAAKVDAVYDAYMAEIAAKKAARG